MSPAITSPAPVVRTRCLGCDLDITGHACADYTVPVTQRATVTARPRSHRDTTADLPGYGESLNGYRPI